jgi:hypothetical protein
MDIHDNLPKWSGHKNHSSLLVPGRQKDKTVSAGHEDRDPLKSI